MWYAERRTMLARWSPELWSDPPHGKPEAHPGETEVRSAERRSRLRRIFPVPDHMHDAPIAEVRAHFDEVERDWAPELDGICGHPEGARDD